jgi:hypothetical protein
MFDHRQEISDEPVYPTHQKKKKEQVTEWLKTRIKNAYQPCRSATTSLISSNQLSL